MPAPTSHKDMTWLENVNIRALATPRQLEYVDALLRLGSMRAVGREFGVNHNAVASAIESLGSAASRKGYAPGHFNGGVAPGYRMGKVTIQRGKDGVERTWERQHPDAELQAKLLQAKIDGLRETIPHYETVATPQINNDELITVYAQGDPHAGLYSWIEETGSSFDLQEFERINVAAINKLVQTAPNSSHALFIDLGDSTHADSNKNRTKSGHVLDVHGRHGEVARVSTRLKRYQIKKLLEKHKHVTYRVNPGNHDEETAVLLMVALEAGYENEPRVTIITSPNRYWYMLFGSVLIGTTHGDGAKGKDLPLIMACDRPQEWAASEHGYRVWFVGHVHHKDIKDYPGVTVEYTRTLAAPDNWSHAMGFRSKRTMEAITYHRTDGEDVRNTVGLWKLRKETKTC